jgi:hypothetical protein
MGSAVRTVLQVTLAAAIAGAAGYAVVLGVDHVLTDPRVRAVTGLVGGAMAGLLVFVAAAWAMRIPEVRQVGQLMRRAR